MTADEPCTGIPGSEASFLAEFMGKYMHVGDSNHGFRLAARPYSTTSESSEAKT